MKQVKKIDESVERALDASYSAGLTTDIESETIPPGLTEETVRFISRTKQEPDFILEWRLKALQVWQSMSEPQWDNLSREPIDYQANSYFPRPKSTAGGPKSLSEVDPKLLETYEKLGIPLHERAALAGVAVDAVFDSV